MSVQSTEPSGVTDVWITEQPTYGRTASGYGGKIPTRYKLRYNGRSLRVYCMVFSNSGSLYVVWHGLDLFLDLDTEYRLKELRDAA